jgi:hypothetical protein
VPRASIASLRVRGSNPLSTLDIDPPIQEDPDAAVGRLGRMDKVNEPGAGRIITETRSPGVKSLRVDALFSAERGCTPAALRVLINERTPVAYSLFSAHHVTSCVYRRDDNLCGNPMGKWVA